MGKKYNRTVKNTKKVSKKLNCSFEWDKKSLTKDGNGQVTIEGWANTEDQDRVSDVVYANAFSKSLAEYMDNPVILFQHDWDQIIGHATAAKIYDGEDNIHPSGKKGLWIKAVISGASDCESVRTKINEGSLKTFSIGYNEIDADYDKNTEINYVHNLELLEISVVTIPCNQHAKFSTTEGEVKHQVSEGLLKFLCESINELDKSEDLDIKFLKELIKLY